MRKKKAAAAPPVHIAPPYFLNPTHPITIRLIGAGGNGSHMLTGLARMNASLHALGHPGIALTAYDGDTVSAANVGRQLFSPGELDMNKAVALITRFNRFYGWDWRAVPRPFTEKMSAEDRECNILISCVDSIKARKMIERVFNRRQTGRQEYLTKYYWMDLGNDLNSGQVCLGTFHDAQHEHTQHKAFLPTVFEKWPQLKLVKDKKTEPSCSAAEALRRQDLYINSTLAQFGCCLIWKLFKEFKIRHQGCYVNLDTFSVNPIKIQ